jgi:hypothetical protein
VKTSKYGVKQGQHGWKISKPSTIDFAFGNAAHVKSKSNENANHDQGKENAQIQHWPVHPQPRYDISGECKLIDYYCLLVIGKQSNTN